MKLNWPARFNPPLFNSDKFNLKDIVSITSLGGHVLDGSSANSNFLQIFTDASEIYGRHSSRNKISPTIIFFFFFFFFLTLVTGRSRSLSLKLSGTGVYEPQIRARLGSTAHFCEVDVLHAHLRRKHSLRNRGESSRKRERVNERLSAQPANAEPCNMNPLVTTNHAP